jgi:hypothetical protein
MQPMQTRSGVSAHAQLTFDPSIVGCEAAVGRTSDLSERYLYNPESWPFGEGARRYTTSAHHSHADRRLKV